VKFLIVGLGNIGEEYANTRHNIGFKVLDHLADESGTFFSSNKLASTASIKHKGRNLILIKPSTYMNLSGKAVSYWMQKEKIPLERLLIITDDLALPFGSLRLRTKGSDGGHNGLKSINESLQSHKYARLRFGIGKEFRPGEQVNYVLSEWSAEENSILKDRIETASEITKAFACLPVAQVMSQYNNK
jgi:PTH1 family peptidyl-tRNA hydrolase